MACHDGRAQTGDEGREEMKYLAAFSLIMALSGCATQPLDLFGDGPKQKGLDISPIIDLPPSIQDKPKQVTQLF